MRSIKKLLLLSIIFCLTSCSYMISDFKKMKGTKYTVEHYQEIVAQYGSYNEGQGEKQINGKTDEQGNLLYDESGTPEIAYELFETQILYGEEEKETEVIAKNYTGFTAVPFQQEIIQSDESTVVKIYYNRNIVTMTACIGEGIWNYKEKKENPLLPDEKENLTLTRKYGSLLNNEIMSTILAEAGKKGCTLTKWLIQEDDNPSSTESSILPMSFPAKDVTYTAVWEEGKPANYNVVHYFEKVDCTDNTELSDKNYEINTSYTRVYSGQPEYMTETKDCVLSIPGFKAKEHSEAEISASGSTIIAIYYVRDVFDLKFATDDGLWNYDKWKNEKESPVSGEKTFSGKFGSPVDYSAIASLKRTGMNLSGWKKSGTETVIKTENLPQIYPAENQSYTAVWTKKSPVSYEIKYMTENLESTDAEDIANYTEYSSNKSKTGIPENFTEAAAIVIPGFTAKEIHQEEIKEDGSTIVYVYYTRNSYKITFDLNGGYWNYTSYRDDKVNVTPESEPKVITGKYEEEIIFPDFAGMGKRANNFISWKNLSDNIKYNTEGLSQKFGKIGSADVVLQAQWEKGKGYEYTVRHHFEKVDSKDSSNNANYELRNDFTQIELGEEIGDTTEAVAKSVEGFTAKTFSQKSIQADGGTVVDIYYTRNSSDFIFDANGGILNGSSSISGKYESVFNSEQTPTAAKDGWTFGGWTLNGKLITNEDLQLVNQSYGIADKTFKAYWVSMISVTAKDMITDITLTKVQTETDVTCTVTLPVGYENEIWTYRWYIDGVVATDDKVFNRSAAALGVGVHTITVKARMNGQNFTKQVTVVIN